MTIGQALAMMRSAEQFKDYQNRLNAQPTIDWRDVTQQAVGPQAPSYPVYQANDVVVTADRPTPEPQYEEPVGPPDQYVVESPIAGEPLPPEAPPPVPFDYGAVVSEPATPQISPADQFAAYQQRTGAMDYGGAFSDFFEPQTGYVARPASQPAAFAQYPFPSEDVARTPLPVPGAPRPSNVVDLGIPRGQTDVPMEEPVPTGVNIAMLEKPAEEKPSWSPGDSFDVKLKLGGKQYDAVVPKYIPGRKPKPINVTVTTAEGKQRPITIDPNIPEQQESYQAIVDAYNKKLPKVDMEFNSRIKVDDQWFDAKVDPKTNRIVYRDPEMGVLPYTGDISTLTEKDFLGPMDQLGRRDQTILSKVQEGRRNWLTPVIESLDAPLTGLRGGDTKAQMRNRLVGRIVPSEGGDQGPVGGVEWWYRTDEGLIPVREAAESGLVTGDIPSRLQEESAVVVERMNSLAKGAQSLQKAEPEDLNARDLGMAQKAKAYWEGEARTRQGREQAEAQAKVNEMQERIDEIMSRTGGTINMGSGINVVRGPGSTTAYSLDPTDISGAIALFSGAPSYVNPQVSPTPTKILTQDEISGTIVDAALGKTQKPVNVTFSSKLEEAINQGLKPVLRRIQDTINQLVKDNPDLTVEELMLDDSTQWYASDTYGRVNPQPVRMSVQEVLDNYKSAMTALLDVANTNDIQNLGKAINMLNQAGSIFTTAIKLPGMDEWITPTKDEMAIKRLNNVGPEIAAANAIELPVVAEPLATFPTRVIAPEEQEAMQKPRESARNKPPVSLAFAYPAFIGPDGKLHKYSGSFSLYSTFSKDESGYKEAGNLFQTDNAQKTAADWLNRVFFDDGGGETLDNRQGQKDAVTKSVQDFNKNIIGDSGWNARRAFGMTLADLTQKAGLQLIEGDDGAAAILENIRTFALPSNGKTDDQINAEIDKAMNRLFPSDSRMQQRMRSTTAGVQSTDMANPGFGYHAGNYKGNLPGSDSRLYDNIKQQWRDALYLYAAAGRGKTSYQSKYNTVSWLVDPTNTTRQVSMLTMPTSTSNTNANVIPYKAASAAPSNAANLPDLKNNDGDPAFAQILMNIPTLLGPVQGDVLNLLKSSSGPVVNAAKRAFEVKADYDPGTGGRNLTNVGTARPDEDKAVRWDNTSADQVLRYYGETMLLTNIFSKERNRDSYDPNARAWIPFSTSKAK